MFSRTDTITDSERFYNSVLELFEDPDEQEEANDLISWWNWYVILVDSVEFNLISSCSQIFPS